MQEASFQLGESSFVHRKSGICLQTRTAIQVEFKDARQASLTNSRRLLLPSHSWFPRARSLRLSLVLAFADDVDLTSIVGSDVRGVVAKHLESADLWKELRYEVSVDRATQQSDRLEFDLRSREYNGSSTLCPDGVCPGILRSVELHLHFKGALRSVEELGKISDVHGDKPESDVTASGLLGFGTYLDALPSTLLREAVVTDCQRKHVLTRLVDSEREETKPKQERQKTSLLDGTVLMSLLDAGFRSSIAARPTRLAAGIGCTTEQGMLRLCDVVPSIFNPNHTQKFEEQAKFIPGISRFLTTFIPFSRPHTPDAHTALEQAPSQRRDTDGEEEATTHIERKLWLTVAKGVQNDEQARRLRPLWSFRRATENGHYADAEMGFRDEDLLGETPDFALHRRPDHEHSREENFFDSATDFEKQADTFACDIPTAIDNGDSHRHSAAAMETCDVDLRLARSRPSDINDLSCDAGGSIDSHNRFRDGTRSPSQLSDVSMLMTPEAPLEGAAIISQPDVIGRHGWLTQNVIRMHPLRQHEQAVSLAHRSALDVGGYSLYERADLGWSEESVSSAGLLESQLLEPQDRTSLQAGTCSSAVDLCEQYSIPQPAHSQDSLVGSNDCERTPILMPAQQNPSYSTTSWEDVLGNDRLRWHTWKRRRSMASSGEDDILEMRAKYGTVTDVKFFDGGWNFDSSDISPGSNENPMLQERAEDESPRKKHTQPAPIPLEKQSYVSPTRSTTSSSASQQGSQSRFHRQGSILRRFAWGGRGKTGEVAEFDMTDFGGRTMEVKRRKTLEDYEMMEMEAKIDDSSEMLF